MENWKTSWIRISSISHQFLNNFHEFKSILFEFTIKFFTIIMILQTIDAIWFIEKWKIEKNGNHRKFMNKIIRKEWKAWIYFLDGISTICIFFIRYDKLENYSCSGTSVGSRFASLLTHPHKSEPTQKEGQKNFTIFIRYCSIKKLQEWVWCKIWENQGWKSFSRLTDFFNFSDGIKCLWLIPWFSVIF